ncbi:ACP S-malonyltransferase [bacterium]|nr:ACP S-malonyltransferase [bacterium]
MSKKRIIVVSPGRGTYTRETSGYLKSCSALAKSHISWMDEMRLKKGYKTLTELDNSIFKTNIHMLGENASTLIYGCSISDFLSIDQSKYQIVGVAGNSMGWYTALALSGAVTIENGYRIIHQMGAMMEKEIIGGQIIYPFMNKDWSLDKLKKIEILKKIEEVSAHVSINLGGYLLIGGSQNSLNKLLKALPKIDKFPFQIPFHAAFHTPLMKEVSKIAFKEISVSLFNKPKIPLIDGRGHIWSPFSTNEKELQDYTLEDQVLNTFDFTRTIEVALKEYCPDHIVLLGPGNTLGGSIGQIMIKNDWLKINSKDSFIKFQKKDPYLISMGEPSQRSYLF